MLVSSSLLLPSIPCPSEIDEHGPLGGTDFAEEASFSIPVSVTLVSERSVDLRR
jgi:hypothetical protein